jgi:hypothetical protein
MDLSIRTIVSAAHQIRQPPSDESQVIVGMRHTTPNGTIDTGRSEQLRNVRYEDLLRAIGSYIDQHNLSDVVITQIPDGVLLKGTMIEQRPGGPIERISAVVFTNEDVVNLLAESARKRGSTGPLGRGFRR